VGQHAKPAAPDNGGHRSIIIADWKPHTKNTLRGFFSATLPSGMVIHNVTVHEKGEARWISLPSREWTNDQGIRQFAKLIEFTDRATANKFRDQVLDALDKHLAERLP
jgi:DNA-binding cell septation regulator SpoVG